VIATGSELHGLPGGSRALDQGVLTDHASGPEEAVKEFSPHFFNFPGNSFIQAATAFQHPESPIGNFAISCIFRKMKSRCSGSIFPANTVVSTGMIVEHTRPKSVHHVYS